MDRRRPPLPAAPQGAGTSARRVGVPRTAGRLLVVAVLALGAWVLAHHVPYEPWHNLYDVRIYHGAVNWWYDGRPLYSYLWKDSPYGFTYPPFAALLMAPMTVLSLQTVKVLHVLASSLVVVAGTCWLVDPVARRHGWPRWFACAAAVPVVFALEPVRETIGFGQVNLFLAALVLADAAALRRGRAWAGVGIGLAAAVKLTPGLFIMYLVLTRRWRAASVAAGTFAGAALVAFAVDPPTSWQFWTSTLWQTDRVGRADKTSNQSVFGLLSRLADPGDASRVVWALLAVAVLVVAMRRAVRAFRAGDELVGVTLTGLAAVLVSPISWSHHLVWVVPALVVLVDVAAGAPGPGTSPASRWAPRQRQAIAAGGALAVFAAFLSSVIWFFERDQGEHHADGLVGLLGESAYVFVLVALVFLLPARGTTSPQPADLTAARDAARSPGPPRPAGWSPR